MEYRNQIILDRLKNSLIVSVQASYGEPLEKEDCMNAMMKTVVSLGGAKVLRLAGKRDIMNAKKMFHDVIVIGLTKPKIIPQNYKELIYITESIEKARTLIEANADIIAIDATLRKRTFEPLKEIIDYIKSEGKLVMADISTVEEGINAIELGCNLISTTLSGYTLESTHSKANTYEGPDFILLEKLIKLNSNTPIVLEGRIWEISQIQKAFQIGAYSVVVGSAITRPQLIVKRFLKGFNHNE